VLKCTPVETSNKKDKLTKETQKGANTFSCLIDGKIFKPGVTAIYKTSYPRKNMTGFFLLPDCIRSDNGFRTFQRFGSLHITELS